MLDFNIDRFISDSITLRPESLFLTDIENNSNRLTDAIKDKSILVIGGAGTIGSSFIKAVLPFQPKALYVVDYSENGLTELTRDLRSQYNDYIPNIYITYPFDFGGNVFIKFFNQHHFDTIACFAAHKHVRSEKDHLAIESMIRNNVFNTKLLLDLAEKRPPENFFTVSTDKAANPVNVMGASKKIMEKVLLAYSMDLKISTARFANVAFSNGSLLYGFINRIMKRQPITAPNDVKRYFVSPEESGQLCMLACMLGDTADIFFPKLDVSQMMTFSTIAELFLQSMGLEPDYCESDDEAREKAGIWKVGSKKYPVYFFETDTSGEKSFEEFFDDTDLLDHNSFEALGRIKASEILTKVTIEEMLEEFERLFNSDSIQKSNLVKLLNDYLPDFEHIETGKSLDQKM